MNLVELLERHLTPSKRLEQVVRQYGADFLSTYGAGGLLALGIATGGVMPYLAAGAAAALIFAVNKFGYDCHELELLETYCDQIAAAMPDPAHPGKPRDPKSLTTDDLHDFVEGRNVVGHCKNNILGSELRNSKRRMWLNVALHAASGAIFGGVALAVQSLSFIPESIAASVGAGAGALLLFQEIDRVVTDIGRTLLEVNYPSAHEQVMLLEDQLYSGQNVRRMQVFEVMVDSDPDLRKAIRDSFEGIGYHHLYLDDRTKAMKRFGVPRGLDDITGALNAGKLEPEDLVLALCDMPEAQRTAALLRVNRPRRKAQSTPHDEPLFQVHWPSLSLGRSREERESEDDKPLGNVAAARGATFFQDKLNKEGANPAPHPGSLPLH